MKDIVKKIRRKIFRRRYITIYEVMLGIAILSIIPVAVISYNLAKSGKITLEGLLWFLMIFG